MNSSTFLALFVLVIVSDLQVRPRRRRHLGHACYAVVAVGLLAVAIASDCVAAQQAGATTGAPATASSPTTAAIGGSSVALAVLNDTSPAGQGDADMAMGELSKALEATDGLKVLDRENIQKILAEHKLSLAGVVQQPVKQGAMLGAKYFLYAQAERNASAATLAFICIEVSSGNVIWERAFALGVISDPKTVGQWASDVARDVHGVIAANEQRRYRPTATLLAIANHGRSSRLDFMEGSLRGLLEDLLDSHGYRVLRRNNPGLLAKETTLGITGMVRPDATVLAEAADLVITASFVESPSGDLAFEQTPIKLTLGLKRRAEPSRYATFTFTLAELMKLTSDLRSVMPAAGAEAIAATAPADDTVSRRMEAARLMAELKELPYELPLDHHIKQVETARRVIYLDPSARDAYYFLGRSLYMQGYVALGTKGYEQSDVYRDSVEAFERYLSFDPPDLHRVDSAFSSMILDLGVVNRSAPAKTLTAMARYIRWKHDHEPKKVPHDICMPLCFFNGWWEGHPAERLGFFRWVEDLYSPRRPTAILLEIAMAYNQLGDKANAAKYLYDCVDLANPGVSEDQGDVRNARFAFNGDLKSLQPYLSAEHYSRIENAFRDRKLEQVALMEAKFGHAYGNAKDLWQYYCNAADYRMAGFNCIKVQMEPVELSGQMTYTGMLGLTEAGLWAQGFDDNNQRVLCFSSGYDKWNAVRVPRSWSEIPKAGVDGTSIVMEQTKHQAISIVQLGHEVLFATVSGGIDVYNISDDSWRHLGAEEGLPDPHLTHMALDPVQECVWIAGSGFLCNYKDGKLRLSTVRLPIRVNWLEVDGDRLIAVGDDDSLLAIDTKGQRVSIAMSKLQQRQALPVQSFFMHSGPGNACFSAFDGRYLPVLRGMAVVEGRCVWLAQSGVMITDHQNRLVDLWRPDSFYWWNGLGGWVCGNCPIPPCGLLQIVPDDKDADLLWLASTFRANGKTMDKAVNYITAFRPGTGQFSRPLQIGDGIVQVQPRGDYLYTTGKLSAVSKKNWVLDQQGVKDQPPAIECPDTLFGHASRALLLGDRDDAKSHLQAALDAGIAPAEAKQMLKALAAQTQPATAPAR